MVSPFAIDLALTMACMSVMVGVPCATAQDVPSDVAFAMNATQEELPYELFPMSDRVIVTNTAMGARCAVAADLNGDGRVDIVSASSNDNAVSWFSYVHTLLS